MAELVWQGKGTRRAPRARPRLLTHEVHGAGADPGANRLLLGEAERVLPSLLPELAGRVALVYFDPPFDTGGSFDYLARVPGAPDGEPRIAVPAYADARGLDAWLAWFYETAVVLHELLAEGGSLYVHLDAHVAHYAKIVLDEVFGARAFQREIVWRIGWVSGFKSRARGWIRNHDTLLFYAKGGKPSTFHKEYVPYPEGYVRRDGNPPRGAGYPIEDVWNASEIDRLDSIQIKSFSGEKVGYPTQKNEALVARVVRASSNPGDLVLDCCVGSGTTAAVAEKLGRRWIACDASPVAVHVTRSRLLRTGKARPFVVQSLGRRLPQGKLAARSAVQGRRCTIELASYAPAGVRPAVGHWSQWLEGWCVDWEHGGEPLLAGSSLWRSRDRLPLSASHAYLRAGKYVALVKAFDVLGGAAMHAVPVCVRR